MRIDVLIFGGGAAGLWCLDRFRRAGYGAFLLESTAIGCGQTIQAQGIIHGGGKYALRGLLDSAAVRATKKMPERWRESLAGVREPNLADAKVLSQQCYLWLPRGSMTAWTQSWGFISLLGKTGLLATPPRRVSKQAWPEGLRGSALAVYSLAEPVVSTGSVLQALAGHHKNYIRLYDSATLSFADDAMKISSVTLKARVVVLAAGAGNHSLLEKVGVQASLLMQRRPLTMILLRGDLPPLFGHCVIGGTTRLTVTTPAPGIWQVGGEIAERLAEEKNFNHARRIGMREIRRWLPGLDLANVEIALYRAVRAEARTANQRRPSGVHAGYVAPRMIVAWPTKLCLAPVLADEVFELARRDLEEPDRQKEHGSDLDSWPTPPLARYPWEEAEWFRAS
jgi:hypothetical protein